MPLERLYMTITSVLELADVVEGRVRAALPDPAVDVVVAAPELVEAGLVEAVAPDQDEDVDLRVGWRGFLRIRSDAPNWPAPGCRRSRPGTSQTGRSCSCFVPFQLRWLSAVLTRPGTRGRELFSQGTPVPRQERLGGSRGQWHQQQKKKK